jgi:outer membrane protein OmpA-like peptidoglycan-associated protein
MPNLHAYFLVLLAALFCGNSLQAQSLEGSWVGVITTEEGKKEKAVLEVTQRKESLKIEVIRGAETYKAKGIFYKKRLEFAEYDKKKADSTTCWQSYSLSFSQEGVSQFLRGTSRAFSALQECAPGVVVFSKKIPAFGLVTTLFTFQDDEGKPVSPSQKQVLQGKDSFYRDIIEAPSLRIGIESYLRVKALGYHDTLFYFTPTKKAKKFHFTLREVKKNDITLLVEVQFKQSQSELTKAAKERLKRLAVWLKDNPKIQAEISGHTSTVGNDKLNLKLSYQRAHAVRNYLKTLGVAGKRLTAKGYGGTRPITSNKTESGRAQNRRVELKVLQVAP